MLVLYCLDFHEQELSLLLASLVWFLGEGLGTIAMMAFVLMISTLCSSSDASWLIAPGLLTLVFAVSIQHHAKN